MTPYLKGDIFRTKPIIFGTYVYVRFFLPGGGGYLSLEKPRLSSASQAGVV